MNRDVTLVVTSCGRLDLLEKTLESFFRFNTYPIAKTIIVEDSGNTNLDFSKIKNIINGPSEIIINPTNLGQMKSIDIAYSKVETGYIFHCEDDWEFFKKGFVEKSFEILDADPKIFTIWLRSHDEKKIKSRIEYDTKYPIGEDYYYLVIDNPNKRWEGGFTLNPGLRKTSDAKKFYPYNDQPVAFVKAGLQLMGEIDLKYYYREAGYRAAIASDPEGYMKHIGGERHITLPWEKQ